jgi:hypothetical protein
MTSPSTIYVFTYYQSRIYIRFTHTYIHRVSLHYLFFHPLSKQKDLSLLKSLSELFKFQKPSGDLKHHLYGQKRKIIKIHITTSIFNSNKNQITYSANTTRRLYPHPIQNSIASTTIRSIAKNSKPI